MPISDIIIGWHISRTRDLHRYSNDELDLITYSLQVILYEIEKIIIIGIIFALLNQFDAFFICFIVLTSIRVNAGGYHSHSSLGCLMSTLAMFFLAIIILPEQISFQFLLLLSIISVTINALYAPVFHIQREHLLIHKKKSSRWISSLTTLFWVIVILLLRNNLAVKALWMIVIQNLQLVMEFYRRKKLTQTT